MRNALFHQGIALVVFLVENFLEFLIHSGADGFGFVGYDIAFHHQLAEHSLNHISYARHTLAYRQINAGGLIMTGEGATYVTNLNDVAMTHLANRFSQFRIVDTGFFHLRYAPFIF